MKRLGFFCGLTLMPLLASAGAPSRPHPEPAAAKIYYRCPNTVTVGVKDLPDGWKAVAAEGAQFVEAETGADGGRLIYCFYGSNGVSRHSIMRIGPEGHTCRVEAKGSHTVVCTPKPKAPVKIK